MKKTKDKKLYIEPEDPFEQPQEPQQEEDEQPEPELNPTAELKAKIESIMYCIPDGVTVDALANKLNLGLKADVSKLLRDLQKDYATRKGAIQLIQDGNFWKFSIPNEHTNLVLDAALPEFDKSILETLAYIGWRGGSRQCDVVRVRSNKAYNHIKLLIEKGFIESHKSGLSKWLQPTKKFYEYFNVKPNQKLPVPKEVEERLIEAEKAAEEAGQSETEQKEQEKQELKENKED
jgi:segregation and condensation protein B